ncbi:MAG: DUF4838 domain-containing protein [Pseudomonadota bacterium]
MRHRSRALVALALCACAAQIAAAAVAATAPAGAPLALARHGVSAYAIYVDPNAPPSVAHSAQALQAYINKVAAVSLPIVGERPRGHFISVGHTAAARAAGFDTSALLYDGFRIATREGNLFILGNDTPGEQLNAQGGASAGTANGVFTFIEDYLGVRWLGPEAGAEVARAVDEVTVAPLERAEAPPFAYRVLPYIGAGAGVPQWERHMKLGKVAAPAHGHAWEETIPADQFKLHPDWFASRGGVHQRPQADYKLETTNPALVQAYAKVIVERFRANPELRAYSLSPSDGSAGWSDSPAALALQEADPHGELSRTPLILKFYNDVARIVGKEFPDRQLAGYLYASYLYPPAAGIPKMESNLALVLASSISYGFQLYRPSARREWEQLARSWGEGARRNGFTLYYYDLPTHVIPNDQAIVPPAPDILNFIFPRLREYGFKGAYVYGMPDWRSAGPGNYAIARMLWKPDQDARALLHDYYEAAYGAAAAVHVEALYQHLDAAYRAFYMRNPKAGYAFTPRHLSEIYAPLAATIEACYQRARAAVAQPEQAQRLALLGEAIAQMQAQLRARRLAPARQG